MNVKRVRHRHGVLYHFLRRIEQLTYFRIHILPKIGFPQVLGLGLCVFGLSQVMMFRVNLPARDRSQKRSLYQLGPVLLSIQFS